MVFSFLVLDDEPVFRNKLKNLIESMEIESKVLTAGTFDEAIERSKMIDVDVYLVDIDLQSDKNGINFIQEIKKVQPMSQIIVISGMAEERYKILQALNDLNALSYIDKPYKAEEVINRLNMAIEYAKVIDNHTVTFKRQNFIKNYKVRDILCIKRVSGGKKKVIIMAFEGVEKISEEEFPIKISLSEIPEKFEREDSVLRCHKSCFVNPKMIRGVDITNNELILPFDIKVPLGDNYKDNIAPFI